MNEQDYKRQDINEYLLGSLSPAETERFDELTFTDDAFAGEVAAAENELIDAYARGELSGALLERFQSYYLASPLRRARVNFAETFQIYGKRNAGEISVNSMSEDARTKQTSGEFFSFLRIFKNQNFLIRFGFAFAALLLIIFGGFWFLNNRPNTETAKQNAASNVQPEPSPLIEEKSSAANREVAAINSAKSATAAPPIPENEPPKKNSNNQTARTPETEKTIAPPKIIVASFVLAPSMRGGRTETVSIPKETTEINVRLELETDDFPAYRIALTDESGSVNLWRGSAIKATSKGENKHLNIRFPAKLLKSQIYTLVVSGIGAGGKTEIAGNYSFRSVIK